MTKVNLLDPTSVSKPNQPIWDTLAAQIAAQKSSQPTVMPQIPADMEIDSFTSPQPPTVAASPPPPPPRPSKNPNLAKDTCLSKQQQQQKTTTTSLKDRIKADYPKVVLSEGQSSSARVVSVVPESPAVVAVPFPPSRSVSLVEQNYQNSCMLESAQAPPPPRPHSACSNNLSSFGGEESAHAAQQPPTVISKSESTLNHLQQQQTSFFTTQHQQQQPSNVYINISGGGSVQIDTSRSGTSGGSMACVTNAAYGVGGGGGVVVDNGGVPAIRHVIHEVHHHHHHFHPPPRLNQTHPSNCGDSSVSSNSNSTTSGTGGLFPVRLSSTNPFLRDLILPGSGTTNSDTAFGQRDENNVLHVLRRNREELRECGWYHGAISMDQANRLLQGTPAGTFLVRDSSSPDCMYALTFQQDAKKFPERSANSVRIRFSGRKNRFQLDPSNNCHSSQLPEFKTVVELIEFYVKSRQVAKAGNLKSSSSSNVLLDEVTGVHYPIFLRRPLRCDKGTVSLQHLARLSVHNAVGKWSSPSSSAGKQFGYRQKNLHSLTQLDLPAQLTKELEEYPYTI